MRCWDGTCMLNHYGQLGRAVIRVSINVAYQFPERNIHYAPTYID